MSETRQTVADILRIPRPPNHGVMAIMNASGDMRLTWDRSLAVEVGNASAQFDQWQRNGYMAYKVTEGGSKGEVLHKFDRSADMIIFAPPLVGG